MICGRPRFTVELAVHEMTNGPNRMKAFGERCAWLVACGPCNCDELTDETKWPINRQMAIKLFYDPLHFHIHTINRIYAVTDEARTPSIVTSNEVLNHYIDLATSNGFVYGKAT